MNALDTATPARPPALADPIVDGVLAFMAQDGVTDEAFNAQALELFAHQFAHNTPFQRFCRQRGKTPRTVKTWQDKAGYDAQAARLVGMFLKNFEKFSTHVDEEVVNAAPGMTA